MIGVKAYVAACNLLGRPGGNERSITAWHMFVRSASKSGITKCREFRECTYGFRAAIQRPQRKVRRTLMRTLNVVLMLLVTAWECPRLRADDDPDVGHRDKALAEGIHDLELTDEQEADIANIQKEYEPKVQDAANKVAAIIKEEMDHVQAVLTSQQKQLLLQALKEHRKEHRVEDLAQRIAHLKDLHLTDTELAKIEEIRGEYCPKIMKAMERLKGFLTDEQRTAREEGFKAGQTRTEVLASLNLTDEQRRKMSAVCKELATFVSQELKKIRDVLTRPAFRAIKEEGKGLLQDQVALLTLNCRDLHLTAEQKMKITGIAKTFRPRIYDLDNKLRVIVKEELDTIIAVLEG
jgi:hypothetical protein